MATLMRKMGIEALYRKPNTRRKHPPHKVYPYLLRTLAIARANHVWAMDITDMPMARGGVSLAAVVDWASRRVLAHRVSITMDTAFCVEALEDAFAKHGRPEIFKTDQGIQFTSAAFIEALNSHGVAIRMGGRGGWRDNGFVERLWRTIKDEHVDLRADDSVSDARAQLGAFIAFYNTRRPHSSLGKKTPDAFYVASRPAIQRAA